MDTNYLHFRRLFLLDPIITSNSVRVLFEYVDSFRGNCQTEICELDCILANDNRTFWIQDVLTWGGHHVALSDTSFRLFWMLTKFQDMGIESIGLTENDKRFVIAPFHSDLRHVLQLKTLLQRGKELMTKSSMVDASLNLSFIRHDAPYDVGIHDAYVAIPESLLPEID